jgi:indole-3-glycerol phosphate synthase
MNLLEKILKHKREEILELKKTVSIEFLKSHASIRKAPPDFHRALRSAPMGLIAEIKRKSPSAGDIRPDLRPDHLAEAYEEAGAHAISILIDRMFFGGEESDFVMARDTVDIPILYKEFVLYGWQVFHAASLGASAVLLIVAALQDDELKELIACTESAGLTPLVEVHTAEEMKRAAASGATCIGINNRDLTTFEVSLDTTFELIREAPKDATIISESGIRGSKDVMRLRDAGVHGVLVGEHLLRKSDVGGAIQELMGEVWAFS